MLITYVVSVESNCIISSPSPIPNMKKIHKTLILGYPQSIFSVMEHSILKLMCVNLSDMYKT